jgi:hypothetical protein
VDQATLNQLSNLLQDVQDLVYRAELPELRDRFAIELFPALLMQGGNAPNAALHAYHLADLLLVARAVEPRPVEVNDVFLNRFKKAYKDALTARGKVVDPGEGLVMP